MALLPNARHSGPRARYWGEFAVAERWWPLHPDLEQLRRQAKELLRDYRAGDAEAAAEFREHHPEATEPGEAQLADAQLTLARSYGFPSWPRLVLSSQMTNAIWADDADTVRELAAAHPELIHHHAHRNWGPPMSFAANLGRDRIVALLHDLGAGDLDWAFARACLQGRMATARRLYGMGGRPSKDAVMWSCETQSGDGLALLVELGAPLTDADGDRLAPVAMLLETYCRNPQGKHRCLELCVRHGVVLPDTPTMALHRGRLDLLEDHLGRDPAVLNRTFDHQEIYPPGLGCHEDHSLALCGTPLDGSTLLHQCVDYDEEEIAQWLIDHGADVNTPARIDADGFGGHTALFDCVVSQPAACRRQGEATMTKRILAAGADPTVRASLRKRLRFVPDETMHEYRNVTPLEWGERFHGRQWVNPAAMAAIAAALGR